MSTNFAMQAIKMNINRQNASLLAYARARTLPLLSLSTTLATFSACTLSHISPIEHDLPLTALTHARVIDGTVNPPKDNATLLVRGNRIEWVQRGEDPIPTDAKVIDLKGKTVMPSLIAAHSHLGLTYGTDAGNQHLDEANVLRQLERFARYGIDAVVSLGTDHDFIYGLRLREQQHTLQVPMILTAGHGFGVPNAAPPEKMGIDQVYRPTTVAEVQKDMDELSKAGPDLVKIWVDDFNHSMRTKMKPEIYEEIIHQAHAHGLRVAAHVYYLSDAKKLVQSGVDILAHSVRDQMVDADFVNLMKLGGTAYIPTLSLDEAFFVYAEGPAWMNSAFFKDALDPGMWEYLHSSKYVVKESAKKDFEIAKKNVKILFDAGIPIGLGTDSGAALTRIQGFTEHHELSLLVSAGLTNAQALAAGTRINAAILGIDDRLGTLRTGKMADFVVLNSNPLEKIENTQDIYEVFLNGVQIPRR